MSCPCESSRYAPCEVACNVPSQHTLRGISRVARGDRRACSRSAADSLPEQSLQIRAQVWAAKHKNAGLVVGATDIEALAKAWSCCRVS